MSATINRRFIELYRNGVIFDDKATAFATLNSSPFLATLKDGEVVAARFYTWYSYNSSKGVYEEVSKPQQTTGYTQTTDIWVEPTGATTRDYAENCYVLTSSSIKNTYDIFKVTATGGVTKGVTIVNGDNFTKQTSNLYTISTQLGLATVYGSNPATTKLTIYDSYETISKLLSGNGITSADGTITVVTSADGSTVKLNMGDSLTKNAQGVVDVNYDNKTIKLGLSGLNVNIDGTTLVSDSSTGVISVNPANTGIYGDKAIAVENHQTSGTTDGKTVKLVIKNGEKVLSQDNNGLSSTISIVKYTTTDYDGTTTLPSNVKERYRLKGIGSSDVLGDYIDIYKDSSLYNVYLGHVDDRITSSTNPTVIEGSGSEALCFIYQKADGTYELVAVGVEDFLQESEFKDGLQVVNHEVSVKPKTNGGIGVDLDGVYINAATSNNLGGIKTGFTATGGAKEYAVQLDGSNKAYVAVPWTDTIPTVNDNKWEVKTKVGSADPVSVGGTTLNASSDASITFIQGSNVTLTSDTSAHTITIAATDTVPNNGTFNIKAKVGSTETTVGGTSANASSATNVTFEQGDGITLTPSAESNKITIGLNLPTAASNSLGGIKTGYATANKKYAVEVDANGNAYVDVPWENTTYTVNDGTFSVKAPVSGTSTVIANTSANASDNSTLSFLEENNNPIKIVGNTTGKSITVKHDTIGTAVTNTSFVKITTDSFGHVATTTSVTKQDLTGLLGCTPTDNTGTVTNIATGTGLTGGPITTTGTISHADIESTDALSTAALVRITTDGIGHIKTTAAATATDITTALGFTPTDNTGTVTNIATGNGLTGGPITITGTISHADIETTTAVSTAALKKITTDGLGHIVTTSDVTSSDISSLVGNGTFTVKTKNSSGTVSNISSTSANTSSNTDVTIEEGDGIGFNTSVANTIRIQNRLAQYSIDENNATISSLPNMLGFNSNGELATMNVWDCGTY